MKIQLYEADISATDGRHTSNLAIFEKAAEAQRGSTKNECCKMHLLFLERMFISAKL